MSTTVLAAAIFVCTYVLISLRRIPFLNLDRATAALLGALLMVVTGVMSLQRAYESVNLDTIALLLGMMMLVAYLKQAGFFESASAWIVRRSGTPRRMLALLVVAAGGLSALFVNDTICLLFAPIVLAATLRAKLNPVPFLIALVTGANVGSAATLIGNPQNMLIGIKSGIPFGQFLLVMLPVAAIGLAVVVATLLFLYRRELPDAFAVAVVDAPPVDVVIVRRVGVVLALMLVAWLVPTESLVPGVSAGQKLPLVALAGGVTAILVGRYRPHVALASVDWSLLLFFAALFVVVGGVRDVGIVERLHAAVEPMLGAGRVRQTAALSAVSVVGGNLVSNVPFVLVAREWIDKFADPRLAWYALAMASTFAGNLTIVGSVANVIVIEQAKDVAPIGFFAYLRAGLPITLMTTALGVAALLAMRALGLPM